MKKRTNLILAGFFILLPIILIYFVIAEMVGIVGSLILPFAEMMPVQEISGFYIADVLAVLIILLVCLLIGLAARTSIGKQIGTSVEKNILSKIPGYSIVKSLTRGFSSTKRNQDFPPVYLLRDGVKELAFIVEKLENGDCVLFVPLAPTPTVGNVIVAGKDKFQRLDASLGSVVNSLSLWGIGS